MPGLHLFDDRLPTLAPIADLRPAWEIRTGALTTRERLEAQFGAACEGLHCGDDLRALARELDPAVRAAGDAPPGLYVNARCSWLPAEAKSLRPGEAIIDPSSGAVAAAHLDSAGAGVLLSTGRHVGSTIAPASPLQLMTRPWHVRTWRDACMAFDLEWLANRITRVTVPAGAVVFGLSSLCVASTAKIYPTALFDLEHGPVIIDEHATIRPGAQLIGPCYVGRHSTVLERATIRPHTSIGPWCKVNGETGGTIFQGYANKSHDGYVGDSYLGEWVNLGAGTTTSNLLNTYGEVIAKASATTGNERTGLQFLGSVIGDHTKTAICTRLMTGCVIHTGAMIATTAAASGCVAPFAWCTDAGARSFRLDKFLEIMQTAMGRRRVTPGPAYAARIAAMHAAIASRS
jgi:UDP-N-acetylglucosamine diphosphorylase / glucose-1-phosphate thymidylyltransferase / UDP-N-acetylgalactosamine diphosphorylase / glucosamine-1-phosphate N-acetyltransferase / galactosamine-1-phosphate N-acetyltransferase